jgi:SAM-dependent methyltransferase
VTVVTPQDVQKWYNHKHAAEGKAAWRPYEAYAVFVEYLQVQAGEKLLDVACGTGYLLKQAADRGLITFGVDISDEGVKIAQEVSPTSHIEVGQAESLNFESGMFDYLTCLGALEHFLDVDRALAEMRRVTTVDARFCIVVPNVNFIGWKLAQQKGTQQQSINERLLSYKGWVELFEKHQFTVAAVHQDKWNGMRLAPFAAPNPVTMLKLLAKKFVWAVLPMHFAYQYIFILRKSS